MSDAERGSGYLLEDYTLLYRMKEWGKTPQVERKFNITNFAYITYVRFPSFLIDMPYLPFTGYGLQITNSLSRASRMSAVLTKAVWMERRRIGRRENADGNQCRPESQKQWQKQGDPPTNWRYGSPSSILSTVMGGKFQCLLVLQWGELMMRHRQSK